jgi:outer membrane protein assembly factor BamA
VLLPRILCLAVALALVGAVPVRAQDGPPEAAEPARQVDVGDLWRMVRHKDAAAEDTRKKFLVFAPSIGSKPSTGLNGGFSSNVAFFLGDPATTHISSLSGGLKVSEKKQTLGGVRFSTFSKDDRWFFQGDNRLSWTSQNTYGLGGDTLSVAAENVKYDLFRFYGTAYRRVEPGLFVGFGLNISNHTNVRPGTGALPTWDESAYVTYNSKHGFAVDGATSSGTSVGLIFDTRDNAINPQRGVLASATYRTFFNGFLGGDSTWQELYLDGRTYRKLTKDGRHKLAFWFLGDLVTGGTAPYLDLPATAFQERSARGYGEGRYRGEHLLYGEMEYRGALTSNGLIGLVAFLNTTTVDNSEAGQKLFESFAPGAGFGFRFLLNKRSRTNLCTDYGWGKNGSRGFYLAIQEAF